MAKWTFYDSFKAQSGTIIPIFLSGLILIGLNIYTLVASETEEVNKTILYTELVCSFIVSIILLLFMSVLIYQDLTYGIIFKNPVGFISAVFILLCSPFGLTIIKSVIQNQEYITYISIATILSTVYNMMFTFVASFRGTLTKK